MKFTIALFGALFIFNNAIAQTLELSTSNPQPRLGQSFTLNINIDTLNQTMFHFLSNNFKVSLSKDQCSNTPEMSVSLEALKKGRNEIGPLTIVFNGIKYTTSKVLILTEQRIPAQTYYEHTDNSMNMTTKTNNDEKEAELTWIEADVANAKVNMRGGSSEMQSIYLPSNELKFKYCYWSYKITIVDKDKPVVLHKSDFRNLPDYYKFQDIVIN